MALSYEETANLMRDATFINRIKIACLVYMHEIMNEPYETPAHVTRLKWAQSVSQTPDSVAMQLAPIVVMDPAIQAAGANVTDSDLQVAVVGAINKML